MDLNSKWVLNTSCCSTFEHFSSKQTSLRFVSLVCTKMVVACLKGIGKKCGRIFHNRDLGGTQSYLSGRRKYSRRE